MFDLSFAEIIVIILVGLMVVGPKEIPSVVRAVVKMFRTAKHWMSGMKQQISEAIELDELQGVANEVKESGKQFILDDEGNYREVYDIKSFIDEKMPADVNETLGTEERDHG